jgi:hypothetical protein
MKWLRRVLVCVLILYGLGLVWGYFRLPLAAIKSLGNYRSIASAPAVSFGNLGVSSTQRWYLGHAFSESPVPAAPSVAVSVEWNALVLARVRSGYHVSPKGAERRDSLYLCVFGAWIPVYNFRREMAWEAAGGGPVAANQAQQQTAGADSAPRVHRSPSPRGC